MRVTFFLLLLFPAIANAQINRSATEFAKENISEYVTTKLFKGTNYKPVFYGELKLLPEVEPGIKSSIEHKFEITETYTENGKKATIQKPYRFMFFFNEKMQVVKAQSYYHSD